MKRFYRLLRMLVIVLLILVVLFEVGRRFLASGYVANQVATRLTQAAGSPVQVEEVDLGVNSSQMRGLRLYEPGEEGKDAKPWVRVEKVEADVTLWDALRGNAIPKQLTLTGAAITLHFDREGQLLTHLPNQTGDHSVLPAVHLSGGSLTINQEGHPPLTLSGIEGDLHSDNGALVVTGNIVDQDWGTWTLHADWSQDSGKGSATLDGLRIALVQERIARLPFIAPSVWQEVNQLEGNVHANLRLSSAGLKDPLQVVLTLVPNEATTVHVRAIDLTGQVTGGKVVVDGGLVKLERVSANTADGALDITSTLDFRQDKQTRMEFQVAARQLNLVKLPGSWNLPKLITGNLSGKAQLMVKVVNGQVQTNGEGKGVIHDAKLAGNPADPIELTLHPAGKGFRFDQPTKAVVPEAEAFSPVLFEMADPPAKPPAAPEEPSYLDVHLGLKKVDLAAFIDKLDVKLPFKLAGQLSFDVQASIPTNDPGDKKAYRLKGSANLDWLTLEGLRLEKVSAKVHYTHGILQLDELNGNVPTSATPNQKPVAPPGSLAGTARAQLFPTGEFQGRLTLQAAPLARLASIVPHGDESVAGLFSGEVTVRAPVDKLTEVKHWQADGTLDSKDLKLFGVRSDALGAAVHLMKGELRVTDLKGKLEGGPVNGKASLTLASPYTFTGQLGLQDVDLSVWKRIDPSLRPPFPVQGRLDLGLETHGTMAPFDLQSKGHIRVQELTVDRVKVGKASASWNVDPKRLVLSDLQAALCKGTVTGSATIPFQPKETGKLDVDFDKLDLTQLAANLPSLPVRLEGRANGSIQTTIPAVAANAERNWNTVLNLRSPQLKLQGIPAEAVEGSVRYRQKEAEYKLQGKTLGGTFDVEGKIPVSAPAAPPPAKSGGKLRFNGVQLDRLWSVLGMEETLRPLHATIDLELTYQHAENGFPTGDGTFTVRRLRWQDTRFSDEALTGKLELDPKQLRVRQRSRLLGGEVSSLVLLDLQRLDRSRYSLALDGVDLARLLAPWPDWAASTRGQLVARVRGFLGNSVTGSGSLSLEDTKLLGINIHEWRLPIDFTYSPSQGMGQLTVQDSSVEFVTGRATGYATLNWGGETRLDGRLRFLNVDLRHVFQGSSITSYGSGLLSGQLDVTGNDIRSPDDVAYHLDATLQRTQAMQFPVFQQLVPFLFRLNSSTIFQEGTLRARLTHGVAHIDQLTLKSDAVRLHMDGSVTVPGERIDLSTTVYTGQLVGGACLPGLVGFSATTNQVPVASQLLALTNRLSPFLLHFHVTGSVRAPTVQIQPLSGLSAEAARFFSR